MTKYCETIGFDITNFFGVFVIEDPTSCPNCGLFASNIDNILKNFGLRNMGDGTVRVQSWCRNCRNYSRRGRKWDVKCVIYLTKTLQDILSGLNIKYVALAPLYWIFFLGIIITWKIIGR